MAAQLPLATPPKEAFMTDRSPTEAGPIREADAPTRDALLELSRAEGLALSLYAPMHRAGKDTRENPIRYKTLLQDARTRLERQGLSGDEADELLGEAFARIDDYEFWQHQDRGLALFVAPGRTAFYRLSAEPPELVTVGRVFYLRPLVDDLNRDRRFFALVLALKGARLFEGSRASFRELDLSELGVPTSLEEATRFDVHDEQTAPYAAAPGRGGGDAVFHGYAGEDTKKEDIEFFFRHLENGVTKRLADENAPLVFVGVEYLFGIYKEANHYRHLHPEAVTGSPDDLPAEEVHRRVWELLEPAFAEEERAALERLGSARANGRGAAELSELLPAAQDGRVDTLFLRRDAHRWGRYDPEARRPTFAEEDTADTDDLIEVTLLHTLRTSGRVLVLDELPDGLDAAAIFRY